MTRENIDMVYNALYAYLDSEKIDEFIPDLILAITDELQDAQKKAQAYEKLLAQFIAASNHE